MAVSRDILQVVLHKLDYFYQVSEPYSLTVLDFLDDSRIKFNAKASSLEPYQLAGICILATWFGLGLWRCLSLRSRSSSDVSLWKRSKSVVFKLLIRLPIVKGIASREIDKTFKNIKDDLMKPYAGQTFKEELPSQGSSSADVLKVLKQYMSLTEVKWMQGRVSGGIYASLENKDLTELMTKVFTETAYTNPLHPDVFPGVRKMEAEVVRMTCHLFNGDDNTCGTMTTGGTESIVMACKAMRDYALAERGITEPEIVAPVTVHAGFDKAGEMLRIRLIHIPVDARTGQVNMAAMKRAVSNRTIMLVGSSPNFPHGIIDPIPEIAKLGLKHNIPVHVDACLGGFLLPFMKDAGFPVPVGDFAIPGVTSISADTHKYGFAPKGSSVVMYREAKYRFHQFSVCTDWPGGVYASPTVSGSRAGANIATCWASLVYHGREGYVDSTRRILQATRKLRKAAESTPGLRVIGDPLMSVVAITSDTFNILEMSGQLSKKGWNLNTLQFPPAFHVCVTMMHTQNGVMDQLIQDIQSIADKLRKDPPSKLSGQAAVYGMAQMIPDRSLIGDFAKFYLDAYYCTK